MTLSNYTPGSFVKLSDPAALGKHITAEHSKIADAITLTNQSITADEANIATINTTLGTLGTAAFLNVGTGASQVVQLTAADKLPAVDGSLLTNLPVQALPVALKTDQQTGTSTTLAVTPDHAQDHDSAAKAWVFCNAAGTVLASYNVSGVVKNSTGSFTTSFTVPFSSANYVYSGFLQQAVGTNGFLEVPTGGQAAGSLKIECISQLVAGVFDPAFWSLVCYGRQ